MKLYAAVSEYGEIFITTIRATKQEVLDAMVKLYPDAMTEPGGACVMEYDDNAGLFGDMIGSVLGIAAPLTAVIGAETTCNQVWPELVEQSPVHVEATTCAAR